MNNGGSIQNKTLTPSTKSITGGPNASKPVSSFTTKTEAYQAFPTKNVTLSYPHKIDWCRPTYVWIGSFTGSETLEIYIYSSVTVWRQSIDRQWCEVCELKRDRIYVSAYLFVCLFVYEKGLLPLDTDLYKLRHCLGLKHNFFRDVPKSIHSKLNMWRWVWTTLVDQVVSASAHCSKGFELEQIKNWLHVCLSATRLLSSFLKTWLLSLITILYMFSVDRTFLWKLILVNKCGFVYRLNNVRLKETHCACASKQVCRSIYHVYWRHALILW